MVTPAGGTTSTNLHPENESLETKLRRLIPEGQPEDSLNFIFRPPITQASRDALLQRITVLEKPGLNPQEVSKFLYDFLKSYEGEGRGALDDFLSSYTRLPCINPYIVAVDFYIHQVLSPIQDRHLDITKIPDEEFIKICKIASVFYLASECLNNQGKDPLMHADELLSLHIFIAQRIGYPVPFTFALPYANEKLNIKEIEDLNLQGTNYIHHLLNDNERLDHFLENRYPEYLRERTNVLMPELRGKYLSMLATKVLFSDLKLDEK